MKDVAEAANVSFKTVSRVVNEESGVSALLANRVHVAIGALGYHRDDRAKSLRRRNERSATIGFAHADMANPFFVAVHEAVERVASEQACLILTGTSGEDVECLDALVCAFAERRVDGLVVVPAANMQASMAPALRAEIERGTPVVFIDREPGLPGDVVLSDHRGGAIRATEHLIRGGHRHIAFIGDQRDLFSAVERRAGFVDAVEKADHMTGKFITDVHNPRAAEKAVVELMRLGVNERPTALFAAQNYIMLGAVKALHALGLQNEIAIVGFDDLVMANVIDPGLTVVAQDVEELGRRAGALLFDRLAGRLSEPVRVVIPVSLIARGSGEIPAPA